MPYNPSNVPDAPLPISMLPDAEPLTLGDFLLVTQPNNTTARSRRVSIQSLLNSNPFIQAPSGIVSNVVQYTGALPQCSFSRSLSKMMVSIDVPVIYDVEFRVWGSSNGATTSSGGSSYHYGLTAITHEYYNGDDQDRDEIHSHYVGHKDESTDNPAPRYSAVFPVPPLPYTPSAGELAAYPNKQVRLYLSSGTSPSPYQATRPSEFTLKIQAVLRPAKYVNDLLALAP